jgi:adenine-specific DNA-methyltransferase
MRNTVIHGDCLNVLPTLAPGSTNFILTDPPYLVNFMARDGRTVPNDNNDGWLKPAFAEMYRVLADGAFCVSFYGWPNADKFLTAYRAAGFRVAGHFVFPKRYTSKTRFVRYQHECAHLLVKGSPWLRDEQTIGDVIDWTYSGNKLHPTQKPISVLMQLIEAFSAPGDLVLDPFAGSGSTLAAAQMLGRRWLGIEIDQPYHGIAMQRMGQSVTRPPLTIHAAQPTVSAGAPL